MAVTEVLYYVVIYNLHTGKSFLEELIVSSTNPQNIVHGITYHENYKRRTLAEHVLPIFWVCSFHGNSMNHLLSYCELIDAKIRASEKDLPVLCKF